MIDRKEVERIIDYEKITLAIFDLALNEQTHNTEDDELKICKQYYADVEIRIACLEEYLKPKPNQWIPIKERLPEEHDSIFARFKGTTNWNDMMFEKISNVVIVTVADQSGKVATTYAHTTDGSWRCDLLRASKSYRITAWQPLPEPYQPKGE